MKELYHTIQEHDVRGIPAHFFSQSTQAIAVALLDCVLYVSDKQSTIGGRIVETEVYEIHDPSSHSYKGKNKKNAAMFSVAGTVYCYVSYGIHHCINIVTGSRDEGNAVLIRALEPCFGIATMQQRRLQSNIKKLTSGPGCLTQALGIDLTYNNTLIQSHHKISSAPLVRTQIYLGVLSSSFLKKNATSVMVGQRIGISKSIDWDLRYFIKDNIYVSSHKRGTPYIRD